MVTRKIGDRLEGLAVGFLSKLENYLRLSKNKVYGNNKANTLSEEPTVSNRQEVMQDVSRNHNHYNL